jgi:UPF0716 family protein affecting phage T7 exclusion
MPGFIHLIIGLILLIFDIKRSADKAAGRSDLCVLKIPSSRDPNSGAMGSAGRTGSAAAGGLRNH